MRGIRIELHTGMEIRRGECIEKCVRLTIMRPGSSQWNCSRGQTLFSL